MLFVKVIIVFLLEVLSVKIFFLIKLIIVVSILLLLIFFVIILLIRVGEELFGKFFKYFILLFLDLFFFLNII